jgi:hypothetical protein
MLSILARFLMLVACVPLLQPTGFCVCKAGVPSRTSPSQDATGQTDSRPALQKTGCCSQRNAQDCHTKSDATEFPVSAPHPCPAPADDDHLPGCPASVGVDRFKWVEPVQSFADALPPVEVTAFLPLEVAAPAANLIPPSTNSSSSPPLYLSHCSLVI